MYVPHVKDRKDRPIGYTHPKCYGPMAVYTVRDRAFPVVENTQAPIIPG